MINHDHRTMAAFKPTAHAVIAKPVGELRIELRPISYQDTMQIPLHHPPKINQTLISCFCFVGGPRVERDLLLYKNSPQTVRGHHPKIAPVGIEPDTNSLEESYATITL